MIKDHSNTAAANAFKNSGREDSGRDSRLFAHPLLWVLAPLAVTVIAGTGMIIKSVESGAVDQLPGEFSKAGKLIVLDAAARRRSQAMAASATAVIDLELGQLRVRLPRPDVADVDSGTRAESVTAHLVHPTQAHKDVRVMLTPVGENLVAALPATVPQRGELHLYPNDFGWRLVAPIVSGQELTFSASRR